MRILLTLATASIAIGLAAQSAAPASISNTVFEMPNGGKMTYGISLPADLAAADDTGGGESEPRPLVLALHPGGSAPYYGSRFMQQIVEPGLRDWNAIIVAPDVPARRWNNEQSEQAVMALVEEVMATHTIDPDRILVTGFSMGGRGTWYFATRHSDLFTGAIAMAAYQGDASLDGLGSMPIQLIHSPSDEVVPFGPAQDTANELATRNHPSGLIQVDGAGHYNMGDYVGPLSQAGRWMWAEWED